MDLSIIIVNWNTRDYLRACLGSLRSAAVSRQPSAISEGEPSAISHQPSGDGEPSAVSHRPSAEGVPSVPTDGCRLTAVGWSGATETLVIDNASTDGSAEMVRKEFPEVTLIANADNRGYAAGNNQGLAMASGEFLLLLNPDTEVPAGALEALIAFLRSQPRAGAVAPRLVHPDGRTQESVRGFPTPAALWGDVTGLGRGTYRVPVAEAREPMPVDQPMTSCFLMRREAYQQIGALDEDFPIFFNDVDLCYRLHQAGWEIWYLPEVSVLHHGGASTRQVRPQMIKESHRSLRRFYAKHYRPRLPAPLYAVTLGAITLSGGLRYLLALAWQRGRSGSAR